MDEQTGLCPGPQWDLGDEHIYKTPLTCPSTVGGMDLLSHHSLQCPSTVFMPLAMEFWKNIVDKASLWENVLRAGGDTALPASQLCPPSFAPDTSGENGPSWVSLAESSGPALLPHLHIVVNSFKFLRISLTLKTWLTSIALLLEYYDLKSFISAPNYTLLHLIIRPPYSLHLSRRFCLSPYP